MRMGLSELIILMIAASVWIIPLVAAVWAVVTLQRIRTTQDDMRQRLDTIERAVRSGPTA
jgi:hypothetical protein